MIRPDRIIARSSKNLAVQMFAALGFAVLLTIGASVVAWVAFNRVGEAQGLVNEGSVPYMASAFGVTRHVGALAHAAPRLASSQTAEEFAEVVEEVAQKRSDFGQGLSELAEGRGTSEGLRRVRVWGRELTRNLTDIEGMVRERIDLDTASMALGARLQAQQARLAALMDTVVDDQFFFALTGYRTLDTDPVPMTEHFTEEEVNRFRRVAELKEGVTNGSHLLATVLTVQDANQMEPLRERYEAVASQAARNLAALGTSMSAEQSEIVSIFEGLYPLAFGSDGVFDVRSRRLAVARRLDYLLRRNPQIAENLDAEIEVMVGLFSTGTVAAARGSTDAIRTGRNILLTLNFIAIVGTLAVAWLFVGRYVLRRLENLSQRMRSMAGGDLEAEVVVEGSDEIADMAAALEVFRRHALEVQRLNLVEKLAADLQAKNADLERVLGDLQQAQDQIVMREKLAALGELTAGVAHEIKNPLNFVKNFSEVSEELIEELLEVLPEVGEAVDDETQDEISGICTDLTESLTSIRQHGDRANRIVHDMLSMGRGSTERYAVAINLLVKEHAALAYHSARAADPDFNLDIQERFDPDVGEVECIPQDLGRVVLNMVANACHATDDRRRDSTEQYFPTLRLSTERTAESVLISVRDNGTGIPPEIRDKIFNPFFTTKNASKGAGLGLALSSDIVREHGGEIRVDSKPGDFTEMVVEIPLAHEGPTAVAAE